jgi:glycerophosphoryl diester phosphodiesterase/arylsulfatase A-like enzyme
VVLISVDGFRPDFYMEPRWPSVMMRRMASEGAHATGVQSVHPSVTYPSHTTIVTGAQPARHGIFYNSPFEPQGQTGAWYWESSAITTPTLWDAVHARGGTTAALWWPVTVGANITWKVPEIWPLDNSDRTASLRNATRPREFLAELESRAVEPMDDRFRGATLSRDDRMAAMASYTLRAKKPSLMLVHFTTTDSYQHSYGREHHMVERAVQTVDRGIARIVEAAEEAGILEQTTFIITGDHGFSDIHTTLAPNVWLAEAGLLGSAPNAGDWRARFHTSGASAFLMLRDPADTAALRIAREAVGSQPQAVQKLLVSIDHAEMTRVGADPNSMFSISGVDGVSMTSASNGAAVRPGKGGTHGHYPGFRNMETGLVAWGAGIRSGARLGQTQLTNVAPLVGALLDLDFVAPDGVLLSGALSFVPPAPRASQTSAVPAVNSTHVANYRAFPNADSLRRFFDARSAAGTLVSAHRGGPARGFPDNALPTFERSLGHGPMLIELDVRRSKDGTLMVLHDDEITRTTTGRGRIGELTRDDLRPLRLRTVDGSATTFPIPTLAEAMAWADKRAVLRLDVKAGVSPEDIVAAVREAKAENRTMAIARSIEEVASYQRLMPSLMLSFWYDPDRDGKLSVAEADALLAMPYDHSRFAVGVGSIRDGWDAAVIDKLRARGVRGMVSTFGELDAAAMRGEWQRFCPLVNARVGMLITDAVPQAAHAVRACASAVSTQ